MDTKEKIARLESKIIQYNTNEVLKSMIFYHLTSLDDTRYTINELICGLSVKKLVSNSRYLYTYKDYLRLIEKADEIIKSKSIEMLEEAALKKENSLEENKKFEFSFLSKMNYLFIRGDAYIDQLLDFSRALYGRLDEEFREVFGFSYIDVERFFIYSLQKYLKTTERIEQNLSDSIEKRNNLIVTVKNGGDDFLKFNSFFKLMNENDYDILREEITEIIGEDIFDNIVKRLRENVGNINRNYTNIEDFNELLSNPIIEIQDNKLIFPTLINSIMNLPKLFHYDFLSLDKNLKNKEKAKKIKGKYGEVRGEVVEDLATSYLNRLFNNNIYNSLEYGQDFNDEADITINYKNIVFLIECKGKLMTLVALQGNFNKIKSDFNDAVQKAYEQSYRTQKYILNQGEFRDEQGNTFSIKKPDRFIKICIVSDYLGHLGTNPELLELFDEDYPLVFDIYDLDYITSKLENADELIDYIDFRLENRMHIQNIDEIELFNFYLHNNVEEFDMKKWDIIKPILQMQDSDYDRDSEIYDYVMNYEFY